MDWGKLWEKYLSLIEFVYNNSNYFRIEMLLYRRLCRIFLCWIEVGDGRDFYLGVIKEMIDTIKFIKEKMKEV